MVEFIGSAMNDVFPASSAAPSKPRKPAAKPAVPDITLTMPATQFTLVPVPRDRIVAPEQSVAVDIAPSVQPTISHSTAAGHRTLDPYALPFSRAFLIFAISLRRRDPLTGNIPIGPPVTVKTTHVDVTGEVIASARPRWTAPPPGLVICGVTSAIQGQGRHHTI